MKLRIDYILSFRNPKERRKHASSLPKTLNEAYDKLIHRIDDNDKVLAFKILSWVYQAKRPLFMDELREAISVEEGDTDIQTEELTSGDDILECCRGLIVRKQSAPEPSEDADTDSDTDSDDSADDGGPSIHESEKSDEDSDDDEEPDAEVEDDSDSSGSTSTYESTEVYDHPTGDIVSFTHQTVKEFLADTHFDQLLPLVEITHTCVRYLAFDEFEKGPCTDKALLKARLEKYNFSRYAAAFWGDHARDAGDDVSDVQREILAFLTSENKKDSMLEIAWNSDRGVTLAKKETILHCLAVRGLSSMCKLILENPSAINRYSHTSPR